MTFTPDGLDGHAALDDRSAVMASRARARRSSLCAYLLYAGPRLGHRRGGLFTDPHQPYLADVAEVLPSLVESSADLVGAIGAAVRFYEQPPAIRGTGVPVLHGSVSDLGSILNTSSCSALRAAGRMPGDEGPVGSHR